MYVNVPFVEVKYSISIAEKFWEISGKKSIDNIQNEIDELNKNFQDESKLAKEKAEKNANKDSTRGASSGSQKFDPVKDVEKIQQQLKNKASNKGKEHNEFPL